MRLGEITKLLRFPVIALTAMLNAQTVYADQIPKPVPGTKTPITHSDVLPIFEAGTRPSEEMLSGTWVLTAQAPHSLCKPFNQEISDFNGLARWYRKGVVSARAFVGLEFKRVKVPAVEVLGQPESSVFSVTHHNLTTRLEDQGPYVVDSETLQFASYFYGSYGDIESDRGEVYNCKIVKGKSDLLVCRTKQFDNGGLYGKAADCASKGRGVFEVFRKKKVTFEADEPAVLEFQK